MLLYKNINMKFKIVFISMIIFCQVSNANVGKETGLEIPRYVSLKSNDANIRVGPVSYTHLTLPTTPYV